MQDGPTGRVYHKGTCASLPGFVMPEYETEPLIVSPESITATASFAAVMAMAEGFYRGYDSVFADRMLRSAVLAYQAMETMFLPGGFVNPEGIVTGSYEDPYDLDEKYWAAAALYKATGESKYHEDFKRYAKGTVRMGYGWEDNGTFGNLLYLSIDQYEVDPGLCQRIQYSIKALGNNLLENVRKSGYGVYVSNYKWGSNYYILENGSHLYDAYVLTGEKKYLEEIKAQKANN